MFQTERLYVVSFNPLIPIDSNYLRFYSLDLSSDIFIRRLSFIFIFFQSVPFP